MSVCYDQIVNVSKFSYNIKIYCKSKYIIEHLKYGSSKYSSLNYIILQFRFV